MEISGAAGATALKQAQTQQSIGFAVLGKANDAAKAEGKAAVALLDSAAETTGKRSSAPGQGQRIDVVA